MTDLLELAEREDDLVPEIMPVDARLSFAALSHNLVSLLTSAADVATLKEVIPNTSYVLIEAFDVRNEVEISATDGERAITVIAPAVVRLSGSALVPAKRMLDILKLTQDTVRVDVIGTTATIRAGRTVWTVSTPPLEASLPNFTPSDQDNWQWVNVNRVELLSALELALPAVARSNARQALMQAEVSKSQITACDGVRAHKVTIPSMSKDFKTTLPLRFIETAIKELRNSTEDYVNLKTTHSTVALTIGTNVLYTQRLNFEFPAVNHLVLGPALQNDERLTLRLPDLVAAIKRVRVNADPEYSAIFLSLRQTKGAWEVVVRARDKSGNASQESVAASYDGPATSKNIALNHRYLLDFLACVKSEEVELRLGESTKTKIAPIYYESETFVGSLQPMASNFIR